MIYKNSLVAIDPSLADPSLDMTKLVPVSEHTFRIDMKSGFGSPGELVVFELDDVGKVVRVKMGENYTYPIDRW